MVPDWRKEEKERTNHTLAFLFFWLLIHRDGDQQLHVPPATVPSPPEWIVFPQTLSQSVFFSLKLFLSDAADGRERGWAVVQKMVPYITCFHWAVYQHVNGVHSIVDMDRLGCLEWGLTLDKNSSPGTLPTTDLQGSLEPLSWEAKACGWLENASEPQQGANSGWHIHELIWSLKDNSRGSLDRLRSPMSGARDVIQWLRTSAALL